MHRLTGIVVSLIVVTTAFIYLWITNPLYAFIGGVVFVVFLIVGYALLKTLSDDKPTGSSIEASEHVLPRRTGEFKRIEDIERPEGSWEDLNTPTPPILKPIPDTVVLSDEDKKKEVLAPPAPTPEPKLEPTRNQTFNPVTDDKPLPPPVIEQETEEILDEDYTWVEQISDDVTNSRLLAGIKDLDEFTETVQEQVNSGASADDLDEFFQSESETELYGNITPENTVNETQFTAYYPRQASAGTEYGFYVYAHLPDALIASDIQQFEERLGGRVPKAKVASQGAEIEADTTITVMIDCDQLKFNQVGAMQVWKAPFVRFDFEFIAHKALVDEVIEGRIAILLGMIEIASIDFEILITPANPISAVIAQADDPLVAIGYEASARASIYQKIFVSYSRNDTMIAEQYRKVQLMLGNTIFMDTHSIRVGEEWESALKKFIDSADVFQLFWSTHSAQSEHVRFEWDYALTHRCPDTRCARFIRPIYWEKPLENIPLELGHLHFSFVEVAL
ncbi:MAG: hypothetical protein Phog2KO_33590 [Phototrophicaceae bacterium]